MYVSFSSDLDDGRPMTAIGRIRAAMRAGAPQATRAPKPIARRRSRRLTREAEEYGADAVVDVRFEVDGVKGPDVDGVDLQRVTATGLAVRFARAA